MSEAGFQYDDKRHETVTMLDGMWLFLASEVLFFGALILAFLVTRGFHPGAFAAAASRTNLVIGGINTVLLISSGIAFVAGLRAVEDRRADSLFRACAITAALGTGFLLLKALEWGLDVREGLLPGAGFVWDGADPNGAQLFFALYFVGTGVHALHMLAGIALVAWLGLRARRGEITAARQNTVEIVGLYWSFVDVVWLVLFPLIYLAGR